MARERFSIADLHWNQPSMYAFCGRDGVSPLRPWGTPIPNWKQMTDEEKADYLPDLQRRAEEADEAMIDRWNRMVPAGGSTVYVLGDVAVKEKDLAIFDRLNGRKKLILGNHDQAKAKTYLKHFYDVASYRIGDGIIMSHIPIHPESLTRKAMAVNVHGHTHADRVMIQRRTGMMRRVPIPGTRRMSWPSPVMETVVDPRYFCVSVEQVDYTPLPWDEMMQQIKDQQWPVPEEDE